MDETFGPDENLLDQIIYKEQSYSVVDYESNGIKIGKDFDFGLEGDLSKRSSSRDYVLDFEIIDNKLWGTKRIYHPKTSEWEKSEKIMVPYTGHFVISVGEHLKEGLTVMDFLDSETAFELHFIDGELMDVNELDEVIAEWKKSVENAENEKKENFVQKHLRGAYNLEFGYGTIALFFSQFDLDFTITDDDGDEEMTFESEEEKRAYQDYIDRLSAPIYPVKKDSKEDSKKQAVRNKTSKKNKSKKPSAIDKVRAKQYGNLGNYFIDHSKFGLNKKLAFGYSLKSAKLGNEMGMFNVAFCYSNGVGITKDEVMALRWFKKLAHTGSVIGDQAVVTLLDDDNSDLFNPRLANRYLEKAASLGDTNAMCSLGYNYQIGRGVKKDSSKAKYWYQKAIIKGNVKALYMLGTLYDHVLNDHESAFEWYLHAAELDDASAAFMVAFAYESGIGVKKNRMECFKWYRMAAYLGNMMAKERLLHLNMDGTDNLNSY